MNGPDPASDLASAEGAAPRRPPMWRSVVAVVGVPLVLGVAGVAAAVGPSAVRAVESASVRLHRETGRRVLAELRPVLDAPHAANEANAELLRSGGGRADDEVRRHLFRQLQTQPDVGYLQIGWEADGGFVGVERAGSGFVTEVSDAARTGKGVYALDATGEPTGPARAFVAGYDARTRPWYRAAVAAGKPTWSDIYQFSAHDRVRLGITAVQPFTEGGRRAAVLGADLVLSQLSEVLGRHPPGDGSVLALVERDGALVASSRGEPFRTQADGTALRVDAASTDDAVVSVAFAAAAGPDGSVRDLVGEGAWHVAGLWVYAAPLTDERGIDWVLLVAVPEEAVVGTLRRDLLGALALALLVLVGGVGAATALSARITAPLRDLAHAARQLARGRSAALPPATTEETQALVAAFDQMRADLARTLRAADEARRDAVEANRAKTTFLHGMSHELRTPLTAILGYTDLLLDDGDLAPQVRVDLERVRVAARHLLSLINDVLDLARVESGRLSLAIEDVDAAVLADEVCAELRPVVERGNRLELRIGPGDAVVQSDRARFRQILVNLLGNAAKYTDDGLVVVEVLPDVDEVTVAVRDTGIGFSPELVQRLFRPYERAPGVSGREGTGLGLAIVQRLVVALGARLDVESEPGRGSRFAVTLPRRFAERAATGVPTVRR